MDTRDLPYFGQPTEQQVAMLKEGKALLNPGFWVHAVPAGLESEGPALAFKHPDYCYLGGYAYVANTDTPEKFRNALACVYGIQYSEHLTTPAKWLSRVLGVEVREVFE